MGSFLSGLFAGSNPTLGGDINNAGGVSGFGTAVGEGDINAASGFYGDLLAGDPAKTAKLLAPQISQITGQGQQQKNTLAQFGTRSGGNNSAAATIDDKTRANIDDMISRLTGEAAAGEAGIGENVLNTGLRANELQAEESQQQKQNQQDSILGGLLTRGVNDAAGFIPGF